MDDLSSIMERDIRERILLEVRRSGRRVIGVCGVNVGDGATTVATALAVSLAKQDHRVVLADLDVETAALSRSLTPQQENGLVQYVKSNTPGETALTVLSLDDSHGLRFLPVGDASSNGHPSPPRIGRLIDALRDQGEFVILDLPAVGESMCAIELAPHIDAFLLVIRAHQTKKRDVERAVAQLRETDTAILGTVLNQYREYVPRRLWRRGKTGNR